MKRSRKKMPLRRIVEGGRQLITLTSPFQEFFRTEAATGALLVACAGCALLVANSAWAGAYHQLWATPMAVGAGEYRMSLTLHQWINDGLMSVFFLLVGLEIKREALAGELASPRQAALPVAAAIGGMLVPAVIYVLTSRGGLAARGWAIPMATDIAFALGMLALIAPRAPSGLKIFLAALAIVDDMGAVLVIALFYTSTINGNALALAGLTLLSLIALNARRVQRLTPYLAIGCALWFFVHASGVHATIAGVWLAFVIPMRTGADGVASSNAPATSPLLRLEQALHGFSAFVVMPLFAFSNAGVSLNGSPGSSVTLAVILGLAIGKPIGITAAALAAVRLRLAALPEGVSWTALHGCAWLGGIGFTMSLFIATLAFQGTPLLDAAKVGILAGSILAGIVGAIVTRMAVR
jgi:NhaA family Na+:H+ antiporter